MNRDWKLTRLGDVLRNVSRPVRLNPENTYRLVGAHWYAKGLYVKGQKSGNEIQAKTLFEVKEGDFVYNRLFAWKGSFAVASKEVNGCFVSNEFPCFAPLDAVDPKFLWLYFSRSSTWSEALGLSSGSTPTSRNRLKEEQFLNLEVRLPSFDEQRRIVSRIEELAIKVKVARSLQLASSRDVSVFKRRESAAVFDALKCGEKPLADLLREDSLNGISTRPESCGPGVEILRISAGTSREDALVNECDVKYLPNEPKNAEKYRLHPGDLLACRFNGNLGFVGRFSLYSGSRCGFQVYPDKLIRFRVKEDEVSPQFVRYMMNSNRGRNQIEPMCATTAGNLGISAKQLKTVNVPIPPLTEQVRIVIYLDDLQAKVDALKKLQSETAAELDALMPSILSRAFCGEL